jgi:aminopeptidase N
VADVVRRFLAVLSVVIGVVAMPGCAEAAVAAPAADPTPGAPGIGDPYFPLDGNGGYDVQSYLLDITYAPAADLLTGVAEVRARATQALSAFNLDLSGLEVRAVTVDGSPATWTRQGGELTVTPGSAVAADARFTTVVTYDGVPKTVQDRWGASGFLHTDDGALVIGQPDVAATWFPANDHPLDTASFTFRITAPEGLEVIANGVFDGATSSNGMTTTTWRAAEPMAPYLAGMAIGEFDVRSYEQDGVRYWDAIDPDLLTQGGPPSVGEVATASFARQPEILAFLKSVFGPYPFSAAGGIVDDVGELRFALESQTRPIYASVFFTDGASGDRVVVHELAHQWFGDSLPVERWRDIWLNEGFATYAEWLWSEREGLGTSQELFERTASIPASDPFWALTIGDPGPAAILDNAVYDRGAMTLHALRGAIGEEAFFRLLTEWPTRQAGENVTTEEFVALAEEVSGQQLDGLFTTWLATPTKPAGLPGT